MFKRISNIVLTIRIFIYMGYSDFIKSILKRREAKKNAPTDYAIAVFNNMTPAFIEALSDILVDREALRLYFSSMSFIIIFRSKASIQTIENMLVRTFENEESAYLLSPIKNSKLLIVGGHSKFMNLDDDNPLNVSTDSLREFFSVLDNLRKQILSQISSETDGTPIIIETSDLGLVKNQDIESPRLSDAEIIDGILDKINKTGIESLDKNELFVLNKISKRHGKKN